MLYALSLCALLATGLTDHPAPSADPTAEVAEVERAAKARRDEVYAAYAKRIEAAKTEADRDVVQRWAEARLRENQRADREALAALMPLLRRSAAAPTALRGLILAAVEGDDAVRAEAGGLLRRHHLTRPDTLALAESPWSLTDEWVADLLRALLADGGAPADRRPRLRYALATHLKRRAEIPDEVRGDPAGAAARYGAEHTAALARADVPKLEAEALDLFDALVREGPRAELLPGVTLTEAARTAAFEIRHLSVGKPAPEIVGNDLDGRPMRLTEFRGKVVVLSFWHSQCSPCLALARHERELVDRFRGRPFAMVGVCGDKDPGQVGPVLERHGITWRSFRCGPEGVLGEIPRAWNVTS